MKEEESKKLEVADPMTAMADETDPLAAVTQVDMNSYLM